MNRLQIIYLNFQLCFIMCVSGFRMNGLSQCPLEQETENSASFFICSITKASNYRIRIELMNR